VTPRGGATGLCGGCVPTYKGVVLSLERMNRIVEVDKSNQMIVAEPGVMLMDFYSQVEALSLPMPVAPGLSNMELSGIMSRVWKLSSPLETLSTWVENS